jgi:hypothetical protein
MTEEPDIFKPSATTQPFQRRGLTVILSPIRRSEAGSIGVVESLNETKALQHYGGVVIDGKGRVTERSPDLIAVPETFMSGPPFGDRGATLTLIDRMRHIDISLTTLTLVVSMTATGRFSESTTTERWPGSGSGLPSNSYSRRRLVVDTL